MEKWFQKKYRVKINNHSPYFGVTDTKAKTITINKKKSKKTGQKGEVLDSIFHETLHAKHPKKSERKIEQMSARGEKKLTKKAKSKLYSLIK